MSLIMGSLLPQSRPAHTEQKLMLMQLSSVNLNPPALNLLIFFLSFSATFFPLILQIL